MVTGISSAGLHLIETFEGFVGHPYQDIVGVWTIGYGHTHGIGPGSPPITQIEAEALLKQDVNGTYGAAVMLLDRTYHLDLNQNQFDAVTSFVYNLGTGVLYDGGFGAYLRAKEFPQAAASMLSYDHAGGMTVPALYRRRVAENMLFLTAPPKRQQHTPRRPPSPLSVLTPAEAAAYGALMQANTQRLKHPGQWLWARLRVIELRRAIYREAVDGKLPDGRKTQKGWAIAGRKARYHLLKQIS